MSVIGTVVSKDLVKLPSGVELPIGTQVKIETSAPVISAVPAEAAPARRSVREVLKDFIGVAEDLPTDLARNHDHYLYGTPKNERGFCRHILFRRTV